ncbi:MAG: helix-turn-helix domain-containing protein [Pseudonocardiales bacterium]
MPLVRYLLVLAPRQPLRILGMVARPGDQQALVPGGQLATLRQAAGLNQEQLGRATFRDRTSVAHIEKGRCRGDERFWKLADDACKAEGVLLAGFRAWEGPPGP